jgi:hypothetical protein
MLTKVIIESERSGEKCQMVFLIDSPVHLDAGVYVSSVSCAELGIIDMRITGASSDQLVDLIMRFVSTEVFCEMTGINQSDDSAGA